MYVLPQSGAVIGEVKATDPDAGDVLTYSLLTADGQRVGNEFPYAIDSEKGKIARIGDVKDSEPGSFKFKVRVQDLAKDEDVATVEIVTRPLVALTGDFYAVEGDRDTMTLTFVRVGPASATVDVLQVYYSVRWDSAREADLANSGDLANVDAETGRVTIPAGHDYVSITLGGEGL